MGAQPRCFRPLLGSYFTLTLMLTGRLFQYSRKPKDVQIYSPQPTQSRGTPNGSQLRHQKSSTDGLAQGSYGTWSGPPPLSPAVSTSRSTLPHATNNSASVYSYTVASGPSREQIIQRAAERGPTDTITFVYFCPCFFSPSLPKLREALRDLSGSGFRIGTSLLFCRHPHLGYRVALPSEPSPEPLQGPVS